MLRRGERRLRQLASRAGTSLQPGAGQRSDLPHVRSKVQDRRWRYPRKAMGAGVGEHPGRALEVESTQPGGNSRAPPPGLLVGSPVVISGLNRTHSASEETTMAAQPTAVSSPAAVRPRPLGCAKRRGRRKTVPRHVPVSTPRPCWGGRAFAVRHNRRTAAASDVPVDAVARAPPPRCWTCQDDNGWVVQTQTKGDGNGHPLPGRGPD